MATTVYVTIPLIIFILYIEFLVLGMQREKDLGTYPARQEETSNRSSKHVHSIYTTKQPGMGQLVSLH